MSPRTTQLDVCVAGLTCATFPAADREQMVGIEPPVWVEATVSEESLTHIVWVEWFGRRLVVDGVHLGPEPGDFDWSHEASNPERHWNLEWMTAADEDRSDPRRG